MPRRSVGSTHLSRCASVAELAEPCRTVVLLAVLTGMRIGEILGLRWKRVDLLRKTIEIAGTFSDGQFGSPKTRSSNRVIPMSSTLGGVLETYRAGAVRNAPDDLLFCTPKAHRLVRRTCTTARSRPHVIGSNNHGYRGIRSGTHMRHSSRSQANRSRPRRRFWGHSDLETTLNT
jgi:integrase